MMSRCVNEAIDEWYALNGNPDVGRNRRAEDARRKRRGLGPTCQCDFCLNKVSSSKRRRSDMTCNCQSCRQLTANGEAILIGDEVLTGSKAAPFMTPAWSNERGLAQNQTELTLNVDDGGFVFEGEPVEG